MSDDLLPELVMPQKVTPEITISDDVLVIPDAKQDLDLDLSSEDEDLMPEPVKKQPLKNEEVFKSVKQTGMPVVAPLVKPTKKKRVLSESQKEALARGREKAKETRLRKKNERLQGISDDNEIKELKTKRKKKDLEDLRVGIEPAPAPAPPPPASQGYSSKEEFDKAVNDAVMKGISGYDNLRKERKVKKQKEQAQEKHEKKIFQDISRATRASNPDDMWASCFQ
tara:strand:+ start:323 stop:997 length:675 start_codon:yes stop_codon:yes gene_type:complete